MADSQPNSGPGGQLGSGQADADAVRAAGALAVRSAIVESGPAIRRYLFGLCGRWHEAEDVAQESLLRAWAGRARFDGRADPRTWLFAIARNCWLDRLRRRRVRPDEEPMEQETIDPEVSSPAALAERGELAAAVEAALGRLPPEQREALALRESDGLTFPQIAQVLQVPLPTVKSRVRYALKKLAEELEPLRKELDQ